MLEQKILNIKTQALEEIKKTLNEKDLFNLRVKYLGRKSEFNAILKNLRNLSGEEKRKTRQKPEGHLGGPAPMAQRLLAGTKPIPL